MIPQPARVLVVDDELQYGLYLREHLQLQGYEVRTATNATDALHHGAEWRPHVLIADWMLQDQIDGLQLAAQLRSEDPGVQTILITGYATDALRDEVGRSDVFAFLEKPFRLEHVSRAVQRAVRGTSDNSPAEHVLVLSPSPLVRQAAADALTLAGVRHTTAEDDPETAVQLLQQESSINVTLIDCLQPTLHQGLLAERLREVRPELRLVGSCESGGAREFAEQGIDAFVSRFCDAIELIDALAPTPVA